MDPHRSFACQPLQGLIYLAAAWLCSSAIPYSVWRARVSASWNCTGNYLPNAAAAACHQPFHVVSAPTKAPAGVCRFECRTDQDGHRDCDGQAASHFLCTRRECVIAEDVSAHLGGTKGWLEEGTTDFMAIRQRSKPDGEGLYLQGMSAH